MEITCFRQKADKQQIIRCKERVSELADSFYKLSNNLDLVGNKVRLQILFLFYEEKRLCVCDLSDILGMTVPAISQHLKKLKESQIITYEKEAQTIFYSLTEEYEKLLNPLFKILSIKEPLELI